MGWSDLILSLSCFALSGFVFYHSRFFPKFTVRGEKLPGPSFFPDLLAFLILIFGFYFFVSGLTSLFKAREELRSSLFKGVSLYKSLSFVIIIGVGFLFYPVLKIFGSVIGITLLGVFLMRFMRVRWFSSLVYSVVLALLIHWIFKVIFKLPLPEGVIFSLLRG